MATKPNEMVVNLPPQYCPQTSCRMSPLCRQYLKKTSLVETSCLPTMTSQLSTAQTLGAISRLHPCYMCTVVTSLLPSQVRPLEAMDREAVSFRVQSIRELLVANEQSTELLNDTLISHRKTCNDVVLEDGVRGW